MVIYELNGIVHWELSPELMSNLVAIIDGELLMDKDQPASMRYPQHVLIELCNFRSALECELARAFYSRTLMQATPADNSDLI